VAYHFDGERQIYIADVIIYAPYRGKGYGRKGLLLLCENSKTNGIRELYDDIAIDSSSVALFLKCGFVEVLRTTEYVLVKKEL
ncbi:MAG: GNAT family N-acetyltransferase, partial [Clostridia bacterium]|nr:GNAT family N-acetyltransferase [Clostridia bacterium]